MMSHNLDSPSASINNQQGNTGEKEKLNKSKSPHKVVANNISNENFSPDDFNPICKVVNEVELKSMSGDTPLAISITSKGNGAKKED